MRIETDPAAMQAVLSLYPAAGAAAFTDDEVLAALTLARIVRGVDAEAVAGAIRDVEAAGHPVERRVVAVGRPPEPGRDAWLEFAALERLPGRDGLPEDPAAATESRIVNVPAGETIALYHPLSDGMPGVNVRGEYVPVAAAIDATPRAGRNVRREGERLVALADGRLIVDKRQMHVDENLTIDGDLTVLRGDIDFIGTLHIRGNVESGLSLRVAKDVLVSGSIFGSDVACGGSLRVKRGIVGGGETRIDVGGNLEADFVENVELTVRGQCQIHKSLVNARVLCGQAFVMPGYGHLVSGQIYARDGIRAAQVGVAHGATVKLVVGIDAIAAQRVVEIDREADGLEERLRKVQSLLDELGPRSEAYATLSEQRRREIDRLAEAQPQLEELRQTLHDERTRVVQQMKKNHEAVISVRGLVHEDTVLQFPYDRLVLREPAKRVTYAFDMNDMRIVTRSLAA
ncbi:MAG: DUF342 domain-containing protein [Candidatus Eisenbacteria bacterium]|uniref:DUF342 domain-containing protein n=1 Tax=Eiseniibacteriota bacterium TaxID=2212470 RepID=A0A938BNY1_UNCEI|nr:DUF342 domain-containing protein [Candidatus Eisenbacteria bacterium]